MNDDPKGAALERAILEAIPTAGLSTIELDIDIVQRRSFGPHEYVATIRKLVAEGRLERIGDRYIKR